MRQGFELSSGAEGLGVVTAWVRRAPPKASLAKLQQAVIQDAHVFQVRHKAGFQVGFRVEGLWVLHWGSVSNAALDH